MRKLVEQSDEKMAELERQSHELATSLQTVQLGESIAAVRVEASVAEQERERRRADKAEAKAFARLKESELQRHAERETARRRISALQEQARLLAPRGPGFGRSLSFCPCPPSLFRVYHLLCSLSLSLSLSLSPHLVQFGG